MSATVHKPRPLDGITVVSLEHAIAAPFCTRQLADLRARVIKIERPGTGDFARAYDERVIRLNPEDIVLLSQQLNAEWSVLPDPSLPRGTLRVESTEGGVEDGPETWRRAIAEALGPC